MLPTLEKVQVSFDDSQRVLMGKWSIKNFMDIREEMIESPWFGTDYYDLQWLIRILPYATDSANVLKVVLGRAPSVKASIKSTLSLDANFVSGCALDEDVSRAAAKGLFFGTRDDVLAKFVDAQGTLSKIYYANIVITDQFYNWSRSGIGRDLVTTLDGKYTDVQFRVGSQIIKAHKVVITSRCRVFEAMFDSDTDEARTGVVTITDIEPDVFRGLLKYLYTGWCIMLTVDFGMRLLIAADKYNFTELIAICKNYLFRAIDKDCVVSILLTTELIMSEDIRNKCLRFISATPHFQNADLETLLLNPTFAKLINEQEIPNGPELSPNANVI